MEHPTLSILRNLPDGYRFDPTDEQILLKYLKPKLLGDPISGNDVIELNICDRNPRDLFCQFKGLRDLYFFCRCEYYDNSKLRKRKITDGGTWKSTGDPKLIAVEDENNRIIGKRRTLVYKNPDDDSKFVTIEYSYTAQLDRPTKGDYVLHKVSRQSNNTKAKAEQVRKKTRPKKKARKGESSNCNAASASASVSAPGNNNLKDMIANFAHGEGEQNNHMASDLDNQYANMMTAISTYDKASESEKSRYAMSSMSASNKGVGSHLTDSLNCDQMTTVSINIDGGTLGFHLENGIPNKMTEMSLYSRPSCQSASCLENYNSYEMSTFSSRNKDEKSFLMNYNFVNQNPIYMTTNLFYDKNKTSCLVTSDFDVQNPSEKVDTSASDEGECSPLTAMPSDSDYQNQFQKANVLVLEDYRSLSMASKVETAVQEVQSQYKETNTPNMEDCSGSLKASSFLETTFEEVQSQCKFDMPNLEDDLGFLVEEFAFPVESSPRLSEILGSLQSVLQKPIHSHGNPNDSGFDTLSNCKKADTSTLDDDEGPLAAFGVGESIPTLDPQQMQDLLAFWELEDSLEPTQQQVIHLEESPNPSGLGTSTPT